MSGPTTPELSAVLFDMDGTLLDSERVWDVSLRELAGALGGPLSDPAREAMVGTNMAVSMDILYADLGLVGRDASIDAAWLDRRTAELFADGLSWRPGARELLATVRGAGLRTALVTSTSRPLVEVAMGTLGAENFDAVVCGGQTPAKPDPAPYREALRQLGLAPSDVLVIEDSPTGTASALAAGCPVLAVPVAAPLSARPGLTMVESLAGLTVTDLRAVWSGSARARPR